MFDLNAWHHGIHQVTGAMALRFNRATAADLQRWAEMLRVVAAEMDAAVAGAGAVLPKDSRQPCALS
jgi:hypothetical protein